MLGLIIENKRHLLTRFPLWLVLIVVFTLSPVIVSSLGAWISELITGEPCHEGNCAWAMMLWFVMVTFPLGGLILLIYLIIVLTDAIKLFRRKT